MCLVPSHSSFIDLLQYKLNEKYYISIFFFFNEGNVPKSIKKTVWHLGPLHLYMLLFMVQKHITIPISGLCSVNTICVLSLHRYIIVTKSGSNQWLSSPHSLQVLFGSCSSYNNANPKPECHTAYPGHHSGLCSSPPTRLGGICSWDFGDELCS